MNQHRLGYLFSLFFILLLGGLLMPQSVEAHNIQATSDEILAQIGFDQRLNAQVPGDISFYDEAGKQVKLQNFLGKTPVVLTLGYLHCPNLCSLVRAGMENSLKQIQLDAGKDFQALVVSIDPSETPTLAANIKKQTIASYDRPDAEKGWHFLTGQHDEIDRLAAAIGFRYAYDPQQEEYAHPSGLVVLTPQGKIARYLYGIEFAPRDLRLALVEAAGNKIGSPVDQILLYCYHYDPSTGKYDLLIMNVIRLAGLATVAAMGLLIFVQVRRGTQVRHPSSIAGTMVGEQRR